MSARHVTTYLDQIQRAAEANQQLTALLAAQDGKENDLLQQIKAAYMQGALTAVELHQLYLEYREITRSTYPASWTSAGLPHPNSLRAAARNA